MLSYPVSLPPLTKPQNIQHLSYKCTLWRYIIYHILGPIYINKPTTIIHLYVLKGLTLTSLSPLFQIKSPFSSYTLFLSISLLFPSMYVVIHEGHFPTSSSKQLGHSIRLVHLKIKVLCQVSSSSFMKAFNALSYQHLMI